jgi:hypothetical protein
MPKPDEIPALVKRVAQALPVERPKLNAPVTVKDGATTRAQMEKVNSDQSVECRIMNQRDGWGAQPSERNAATQVGGFAGLNSALTFTRIAASPFSHSNYMKSRRVG